MRINLLGLNDENSVKKRYLAISAGQFVAKDCQLDAEDALTKENVMNRPIHKMTDLKQKTFTEADKFVREFMGAVMVDQSVSSIDDFHGLCTSGTKFS